MKKICIFLMSVDRWYYLILGALLALFVFSQVSSVREMLPSDGGFPFVQILIFGSPFLMQGIAFTEFYTGEERISKRKSGEIIMERVYIVQDHYFPIKINADITTPKRIFGYLYSICRVLVTFECGYLLIAMIFMFLIEGK